MPDSPRQTEYDRLAVCQAPLGGDYVPADHITNGRCFMDCNCTPRLYVALDAVLGALRGEDFRNAMGAADFIQRRFGQ